LLFALCFMLCACGRHEGGVYYNGHELSEDEIWELISREESEAVVEREYLSFDGKSAEPTALSVFWTESGSVYHLTASCRHLINKTKNYYGTAEDAASCKKPRVCSACAKE